MIQKADTGNNKTFFFFRYLGCPYLYIIPFIITITLPGIGWVAVWGTRVPIPTVPPTQNEDRNANECEV